LAIHAVVHPPTRPSIHPLPRSPGIDMDIDIVAAKKNERSLLVPLESIK
jgi:hypothetical protein